MPKENKNDDFNQQFLSSMLVFDARSQQYHNACVCIPSDCEQGVVHACQHYHAHASRYCCETEEKKLLNKDFFFFAHKKYSRSFRKLWFSKMTDVKWTISTMSLLAFWALNILVVLRSMQG